MTFFDINQQGRIINRVSNDTSSVDDFLPYNGTVLVEFVLRCIGTPIAIMYIF